MEMYNYCLSQPEIPDVDMSFSNDTVTAYLSGSEQRTEEITFEADELQTVTFDLPSGVKLHNTTTGKTSAAGASVTISGGTTFYLSAPLTQAADGNASWSATMKGSITKEYSAYKITTGSSTQDLAFVFGEGVDSEKYVSFKVTWLKLAYIRVVKSDADSGNALSGAVFGVYSDAACTQLIDTMTATGSDGVSELQIVMTQNTVYLKELTTPTGYLLNTTVYPVELEVGSTTTVSVPDERVTAHISLTKTDSETGGTAQGDATLEGAVYGLYAREDIVHPDGTTGTIYQAGELVATLTTDANGEAEIGDLYLGAYYVKELTPSEGYNLDETEYDLTCDYEGDLVATVERSCTSQEDVIKQPFQVIKAANNGKTDADLLSGVGFTVYLVSSLGVNADGSYDFASAEPVGVTADGGTEMFTDETGYACSIALVNVVKDIVEHIFNYVTGNLTDVTFEVYTAEDIKAADGVSEDYYKVDELVATITTDEYGIARLEGLPLGQYYVKEIGTVYGYVLDNEIRYVNLRYQDQDTPVVVYDEAWQNDRQKVSVHVVNRKGHWENAARRDFRAVCCGGYCVCVRHRLDRGG